MIHLVVALDEEAQPAIDRYGLVRRPVAGRLRLWTGDGMRLAVAGMGRSAAAAAVGYLGGVHGGGGPATWINFGIGGHPRRAIGEVVLADRIVETATGRSWRPDRPFPSPCAVDTVCTVDRIERDYPRSRVYEMEAAGFFQAARRFDPAARIHVLKVISDNRLEPVGELTLERSGELATAGLPVLEELIRRCRRVGAAHGDEAG